MEIVKEIPLVATEWQIKGIEQLNKMKSAIAFINEQFVEFET